MTSPANRQFIRRNLPKAGVFLLAAAFSLMMGFAAQANGTPTPANPTWGDMVGLTETAGEAGLSRLGASPEQIVGRLIGAGIGLLGTVFVALLIYGGIIWMTAQGNEDKVKKAKGIITSAVIGLVVVFSAYAIANFVVGAIATSFEEAPAPSEPAGP